MAQYAEPPVTAASDDDLRALWADLVPHENFDSGPEWWIAASVADLFAASPSAAAGARWRLLNDSDITGPIAAAWDECSEKRPCLTPHCDRCSGPSGVVQKRVAGIIEKLFAGVPRDKIKVVTHHLEAVRIDPNDHSGSSSSIAKKKTKWRATLIKRIQRASRNARVFAALEDEPRRVGNASDLIYSKRDWRSCFQPDDIVALIHVHAVVYDPDDALDRVWRSARSKVLGSLQTRIRQYTPPDRPLPAWQDGVAYVAGYGVKRHLGWNFGDDTLGVFLIASLVHHELGLSGLSFTVGGRRARSRTLRNQNTTEVVDDVVPKLDEKFGKRVESRPSYLIVSFDSAPGICREFRRLAKPLSIRATGIVYRSRAPPRSSV